MTNERAILILKIYKKRLDQLDADVDAFELAIKALEAPSYEEGYNRGYAEGLSEGVD